MGRRELIDLLVNGRTKAGLTQAQLAAKAKVSAQQVSRWERGSAVPGPKVLGRIAEILGLDPGELYQAAVGASQQDAKRASREANELRDQYEATLEEMREIVTVNRDINHQIGQDIASLRDVFAEMLSMLAEIRDALTRRPGRRANPE